MTSSLLQKSCSTSKLWTALYWLSGLGAIGVVGYYMAANFGWVSNALAGKTGWWMILQILVIALPILFIVWTMQRIRCLENKGPYEYDVDQ